MGFFRRLLGLEIKNDPMLREAEIRGGIPIGSQRVTAETALYVSTVLACVRVIANGIAQVPFRVYQEEGDGGRTPAADHPLAQLIYRRPNKWQTSYEFRETIMFHVLLTGNAYVFVNRVGSQRQVLELVPLEPKRVEVKQLPDLSLEYRVSSDTGAAKTFGADAIWHLRGPSWNSWQGLEAVRLAREAIGLAQSLEAGQKHFQDNGAKTSGVLSMTNKLSPEQFTFLAAWLDKHLPGGERFGKPIVLDNDASYTSMAMSAVDQQLIETRKHQIEEICRGFGVMPIMVGHADKTATYASAEQMFLAHVVHTLSPWYQRIEQSADVNLLSEDDLAQGFYTKFTPNALMRGAASDRAAFYTAALGTTQQPGWMTKNEVRALEELSPVEGGDTFPELITGQQAPSDEPEPAEE